MSPPAVAAPCPASTRTSVARALRRAGEEGAFQLGCLPGRVVLDLAGPPTAHAVVSVSDPEETWVGTALVRIAHVQRLERPSAGQRTDGLPTASAPTSPVATVTIRPSPVDAMPDRSLPILRLGLSRFSGLWAPGVEVVARLGRWEQGLSLVASWNGTDLGVVRGQLVAWTVGRLLPLNAIPGRGVVLVPRVTTGLLRMTGAAGPAATAPEPVLRPVAEAALDAWVRPDLGWPLALGMRFGARAGPTATSGGEDALSWSGPTATFLVAWEAR